MSLLERPLLGTHGSAVGVPTLRSDDLEEVFRQWVRDPAKPERVTVGEHGELAMAELARRLAGSRTTLPDPFCEQLGLPPGVTVGTAVAELIRATADPLGPRCRSFRSAVFYLRGLARLDLGSLDPSPDSPRGERRVSRRGVSTRAR